MLIPGPAMGGGGHHRPPRRSGPCSAERPRRRSEHGPLRDRSGRPCLARSFYRGDRSADRREGGGLLDRRFRGQSLSRCSRWRGGVRGRSRSPRGCRRHRRPAGEGRLCPRLDLHRPRSSRTTPKRVAERTPMDGARVYPVSGGSEAMETALKLARAYHLARGEPHRTQLLARHGSYHGNSLGALDVSGRAALRSSVSPVAGSDGSPAAGLRVSVPRSRSPLGLWCLARGRIGAGDRHTGRCRGFHRRIGGRGDARSRGAAG